MSKVRISHNAAQLREERLSTGHHFALIRIARAVDGADGDAIVEIGNVVANFALGNDVVAILNL